VIFNQNEAKLTKNYLKIKKKKYLHKHILYFFYVFYVFMFLCFYVFMFLCFYVFMFLFICL